jgi:hypothetical protein
MPAAAPSGAAPPPISDPEDGSAEVEEDEDVARLPRPRPAGEEQAGLEQVRSEPAAAEAVEPSGAAFDLLAGAALPEQPPASPAYAPEARRDGIVAAAASPAAPATPDLVAGKDCLAPAKAADRDEDFRRNESALSAPGFCIAQEKFRERRRNWTVQTVESGRPGPLWVVIHDDENNSFDTAVWALTEYGGRLVTLDTGGKRNQDGADPNRNFSDEEIGCRKLGKSASPRFSAAFRKLIDPVQPVIALHNNSAGGAPTGGLGHLSMKTLPRGMERSPSVDPDSELASDYALVLVTAAEPAGPAVERQMAELSGKGLNVVLETVAEGEGDCSLSNYAVLAGHPTFMNVTVHHDEAKKQRKMLEAVLASTPAVSAAR